MSPLFVSRFVERVRVCVFFRGFVVMGLGVVKSMKSSGVQGVGWVISRLFVLVLGVNFFGLVPWVIRVSRHLVFSVVLAFPL